MQRITVELAWTVRGKPERRPVEGWSSGVPGLVIVPGTGSHDRWQLVHQASGLLIRGGFSSRKAAGAGAEALRRVCDWTLPADELQRVEGFAGRRAEALGDERLQAVSVHGWVG